MSSAHAGFSPDLNFDTVLIADERPHDPTGATAIREAIDAAGGRLRCCRDWGAVAVGLPEIAGRPVVVANAAGIAVDLLAVALPRLDAAAGALGLPVVALIEPEQIDIAAATLLSARTELLCAASLGETVAVLSMIGRGADAPSLHDTVREGEAERLRELNAEVARIAEVLTRLTLRDRNQPAPGRAMAAPAFTAGEATSAITAAEIRRIIRARRLRDSFFNQAIFEDPAWDMLLDLFAAELERAQVSVSSLCIAAAVAPTTALRWISRMTEAGLLERHPDPFDRRRAFMALSTRAREAMHGYFATLERGGLPFG